MEHILLSISFVVVAVVGACRSAKAQQDTNYWHYHELIYKAECVLFDSNINVEQGFQYYDQAFNNFEFNYVHDLVNAAQLAHYYQRDYMKYLKKGVRYGLKPANMNFIPVWQEQTVAQEFLEYFQSTEGQTIRQQYLTTINQEYLAWLYQFSLTAEKIRRKTSFAEYCQRCVEWDKELAQKITESGYPGTKQVGIDDSLLYKELKNKDLNFNYLVQISADSLCATLDTLPKPYVFGTDTIWMRIVESEYVCFELDDECLSQHFPITYLIIHKCPLRNFAFINDEIAKGNLHPREFAYIIDESHTPNSAGELECDCGQYANCFFRIGGGDQDIFADLFLAEDETDALQKQYWIIPLRVERAKTDFGEEHGYRFNWGNHNCFK